MQTSKSTPSQGTLIQSNLVEQVSTFPSISASKSSQLESFENSSEIDKAESEDLVENTDPTSHDIDRATELEWHSVSPGKTGKQIGNNKNDNNSFEVSPSRFSVFDTQEDRLGKDDLAKENEVEEGEIECQTTSTGLGEEMKTHMGFKPSLPRGSKIATKTSKDSSIQGSRDKVSSAWKRKAPKKKN